MRIILFILMGMVLKYIYNLLLKIFNLNRSIRVNNKEYNRLLLEDILKHLVVILTLLVIGLIIILIGSIFKIFVIGGI